MNRTELINAPGIPELRISVPAKVACFSVRQWLWELGTGEPWSRGDIFEEFGKASLSQKLSTPRTDGELRIAIHRDGVDRMRAVYDHRILKLGDWTKCSLDEFSFNLANACTESNLVNHHTRPQWNWLGGDPGEFDIILPLGRIGLLPELAADHLKREVPALPHSHRTETPTEVSDLAWDLLSRWTAYDTAIGWNGETTKGI